MESLEKSKTAEAILTDRLSGAGIENVDEHILFRVPREESRKDFDEFFLVSGARLFKTVADEQAVGTFAAVQSHPKPRTVGADLVQPFAVFQDPRLDFLEADVLGRREIRKRQCGCQEKNCYSSRHPH
jgi:hypothetical protein